MKHRLVQPIRFSHCDPAGVLYFPHVFDFVNAAMEDWFAQSLGLPFHVLHLELRRGNPVVRMVPPRDLRLPSLVIDAEFLRARWTLCAISFATMRSVPLPDDLRRGMTRFLA